MTWGVRAAANLPPLHCNIAWVKLLVPSFNKNGGFIFGHVVTHFGLTKKDDMG